MVHWEQQWLDFSLCVYLRLPVVNMLWIFFSSDIQTHLDSVSGWKIGHEATGLCKMSKNLALLKPRVTFPPISRAKVTHDISDWANGICIVQIGAGKGGNCWFSLCASVTQKLSPCHVSRRAREGVGAEVWWCCPVSEVWRIHRHVLFCTVSTPELYAGIHRTI